MVVFLTLIVVSNSGCEPTVAIGPRVRDVYTLVHSGRPLQVLENTTVKGRVLEGSGDAVDQDVGGWIMMPPDHWETVKKSLK
jgi:hypothetical protein